MKKTKWKNVDVYELLRRIDEGYAPDANEAAMLAARTELDLSGTRITALPESLGQLTSLQVLDLRGTRITALPESLGQLTSLQTLNLWDTPITALPESLRLLTSLQRLDLSYTQITALPDSIGWLTNLQWLNLSVTPTTALPESLGQLTNLQTLDLSYTQITALPESIGLLTNLQTLSLSNTPITALPESIGLLRSLKELYLDGTQITAMPESVGQLTSLQELFLFSTSITALPDSICLLSNLQLLSLTETKITALPKSLNKLTKLQELYLFDTPIVVLPEALGQLTSLQTLNLGRTQITALPEALGQLTSLQELGLSDTPITALPESVGHLTSLKGLFLSGTKIAALPEWIGALPALQRLDLAGLTLPALPRSLALRGLPFVDKETFYFDDTDVNLHNVILTEQELSVFLETPELIPSLYEDQIRVPECRVIFLGDGDSGKTYTIRRIQNGGKKESEENPYPTKETPGVEIADWHVIRDGGDLDLHFWDFGGQEILHSMHRCFLTDQTCYVVTVKSRETKGTNRARYWLRNIRAFAPNSPILLYVNCWENDNGRRCIDEPQLLDDFKDLNIVNVVYVSAKEAEDTDFSEKLMKPLIDMAAASEGCRRTVNRRWVEVRNAIARESRPVDGKGRHYLTRERYHEICQEAGVEDENAPALLTYFNALGVCFSYHRDEEDNELNNYKLLNPVWLTNAVYAIIEEGMAHAQEGRISLASIQQMLGHQEPDSLIVRDAAGREIVKSYRRTMPGLVYQKRECQYVIDVAAARNLCYREADGTLFFPALCTNNTPAEALENPEDYPQHIEYLLQYEYLPDSVVHQLIIRCRKADLTVNHCWLRGMILGSMDAHKAIVRMDGDEGLRIEVWSKPDRPAYELFELLRREILAINKSLNLKAQELIVEGRSQLPVEDLLPAARDKAYVYCGGKKILAEKLLGQFYENWTIQFMRVEENGVITVPILPRTFHARSKDNQNLRKALYKAYNGYCPYCGKPIPEIQDMQVDHILPQEYVELPELSEYVSYLDQRGFDVKKPDYVENYFPSHRDCNGKKSNHVDPYALLFWHQFAASRAPTVLRLIETYKKANKE